ncbi:DUF317 domain-containing protein, partial [Streptomyces sp. NPDC005202]|uniref:DUF317 domain-containing protein n=1 Tax=Streptomyces sp. NPDC005202 TaxID=3157021 RepID=UPI0033A23E0F
GRPPGDHRCPHSKNHRNPARDRRSKFTRWIEDQFSANDFHLVVDDRADVHVNSKDGRFYLGWFSLGRPGTDGEGWKIAVTGTAKVRGYQMSFDTETPADVVAAAGARVLETSQQA